MYECKRCGCKKWVIKIGGSVCTSCKIFVPFNVNDVIECDWEHIEGEPAGLSEDAKRGILLIEKSLRRKSDNAN